jgi:hypothetical protein
MKVFRIRLNSNDFLSFLPADPTIWQTDLLKLDCKPKLPAWKPPAVYAVTPKLKQGNFFHLCSGAFVVDSSACEALRTILEMAGELLPLPHQDALFHLVNVLQCVNCLDEQNTEWVLGKTTNAKIRIKEYHFHANRFSESTLFKIPETALGEVLTLSGVKDPKDEFKSLVERQGLQGIIFEEVWSGCR